MSRLALVLVAACTLSTAASGCGSLASYPMDRLQDLSDVFGGEFYWGQGFLANARGTKVVQLGAGSFDGNIASYDKRAVGVATEIRAEAGLPLYYFTTYDRKSEIGNRVFNERVDEIDVLGVVKYNLTDPQDRSFYEVGVSVAAFAGVGVHVDVLQAIDFVLGIVGLDIGKDDARHRDVQAPVHGPRYQKISELPITKA